MQPEKQARLAAYTQAAQAIIYEPQRLKTLIGMCATKSGMVQAIRTVISALEQRKPIPPAIAPLLAANIFVTLVDAGKQISGQDPEPQFVADMLKKIVVLFTKQYATKGRPQQANQSPAPQGGLLQGAM